MTSDDAGVIDATMGVLADPTRRWLLNKLQATDQLSVDRITAELAGGNGPHVGGPAPDDRKRIEVSLRHVHLPKMADAGTVEWDSDTGRIVANGNTEVAYELLAI